MSDFDRRSAVWRGEARAPAPPPAMPAPSFSTEPRFSGRPWIERGLARGTLISLIVTTGLLTVLLEFASQPVGFVAGVVLAAVPVFPVVATLLWLDRWEAEPTRFLVFAFLWGATVAGFAAGFLNTVADYALGGTFDEPAPLTVVGVAPVVEEVLKGLGILAVLAARRHQFHGVVDGIVYAGMVGIGFAFVENISYLSLALAQGGPAELQATFVARCIASPFAHSMFTAATGVGIGLAVASSRGVVRVIAPVLGLLAAIALHALWNGLATVLAPEAWGGAYILLELPIFIAFARLAVVARRRQGTVVQRHIGLYVQTGWLTPQAAQLLGTLEGRRSLRQQAAARGEETAEGVRRAIALVSELALLRERMARGTAPPAAAQEEHAMLHGLWLLTAWLGLGAGSAAAGAGGGPPPGARTRRLLG